MKQILKAKSAGEKMYQLLRLHSKMIELSKNPVLLNKHYGTDEYLIDSAIESINALVDCFIDIPLSRKQTKRLNRYKKALHGVKFQVEQHRKSKRHTCKHSFQNLYGEYSKLKDVVQSVVRKLCEIEYHNTCVPINDLLSDHKLN